MAKGGFPRGGMMGGGMMRQQAQMQQKIMKMQKELEKAQKEVEETIFTASVGGGTVKASCNGKKELTELVELADNVTVFSELKAGRIDAFVVDEVVGRYLISKDAEQAK